MLICTLASNICGVVMPAEVIGKLCREYGILFIADAAQSAGLIETNVQKCGIDALCLPSHKGLYGPQGAGAVLFSSRASRFQKSVIEGGSGSDSLNPDMPSVLPDRLEAGTAPTPSVAGLSAGIDFVRSCGIRELQRYEASLSERLSNELLCDKRFTVYGCSSRTGTVLFNVKGKPSVEVSSALDERGICTRAGFHCAPLAHKTLGTADSGAVRVSFGAFNGASDVDAVLDALIKL